MKPFISSLCNNDNVIQLFESVQTGIMIISKDFHVLTANRAAKLIFGKDQAYLDSDMLCHSLFFQKPTPCEDCPINDDTKPWPKQKSMTLKRREGDNLLIKVQFSRWDDYIVMTLHDVSHEVNLLRRIDLMRKEQQAKNVLLERRKQTIDEDRRLLEQLLNHLPEALVTVNSSYIVQRKNKAAGDILPVISASKCYEIFGHDHLCDNCPAEQGFEAGNSKKKSHAVKNRYLTETIAKSPFDDGGLLIFRDTTREIQLIGQIREQQETIKRKNDILSKLVDLGAQMQKEPDVKLFIDFFLDLFLVIIKSNAAGVIINDVRAGNLWFTANRRIENEQMNLLTRAYLSRDIQSSQSDIIAEEFLPWVNTTQKVLIGANGSRVGLLVLKGEYRNDDQELIKLFTEPLGAYFHNRLLSRQLEEKANTDALTGLYNRGYIDQALNEEKDKLDKYGINYAVVVVDVNRLKMANDLYGHEAGDKLILTVTKMLKKGVRPTDIVARTGGDEFLILLTNTTTNGANSFIQRLNNEVFNDVTMEVGSNEPFPVTVSLGAAGTDEYSPENLTKEADKFMYAAKEAYYKTHKKYR